MVAMVPMSMSFLSTSPALTPIALARSATVITSEMRTTRLEARGVVISVFFCSLPGSARRFCGRLPARAKSRSITSKRSLFLMTLRPFLRLPASPGGCPGTAPGSPAGAAGGRQPDAAGGATALRRSIFPSTFGPRISSNPGGGGAGGRVGGTASRAGGAATGFTGLGAAASTGGAAAGGGGAGSAGGSTTGGGTSGTAGRTSADDVRAQPRLGRLLAGGHHLIADADPLPDHALGDHALRAHGDGRLGSETEPLAQPLDLLVRERALRALPADAEALGARDQVLGRDPPLLGELVDTLGHDAPLTRIRAPLRGRRRAPPARRGRGCGAASAPGRGGARRRPSTRAHDGGKHRGPGRGARRRAAGRPQRPRSARGCPGAPAARSRRRCGSASLPALLAPGRRGRLADGGRRLLLGLLAGDVLPCGGEDAARALGAEAVDLGDRLLVRRRQLLRRLEPVLIEQLRGHVADAGNRGDRRARPPCLLLRLGLAAHVELPAGQARGQAHVLSLLADRE